MASNLDPTCSHALKVLTAIAGIGNERLRLEKMKIETQSDAGRRHIGARSDAIARLQENDRGKLRLVRSCGAKQVSEGAADDGNLGFRRGLR